MVPATCVPCQELFSRRSCRCRTRRQRPSRRDRRDRRRAHRRRCREGIARSCRTRGRTCPARSGWFGSDAGVDHGDADARRAGGDVPGTRQVGAADGFEEVPLEGPVAGRPQRTRSTCRWARDGWSSCGRAPRTPPRDRTRACGPTLRRRRRAAAGRDATRTRRRSSRASPPPVVPPRSRRARRYCWAAARCAGRPPVTAGSRYLTTIWRTGAGAVAASAFFATRLGPLFRMLA